jgi:hypothetical protein
MLLDAGRAKEVLMSLERRQNEMLQRMRAEGAGERAERTGTTERSAFGHSAGIATAQTQAGSRPARSTTDVQTDAPRARLLDLKSAGAYLGVSYWTMRDLVFGGAIPSVKIPCPRARDGRVIRRILVDRRDLDTFIDNNKQLEQ